MPGPGTVAVLEERACPLDMGPDPSWVRGSARVRYVPSACLVARTDAVRGSGGFEESMRTGEDVDLVWRLADAGHLVRYDPSFVVLHRSRPTLMRALTQRAGYGRSAGALARRHGSAVAPFRSSLMDATALVAFAIGAWMPGSVVLTVSLAARLARLIRLGAPVRAAVALTGTSAVALVSHAAAALVRTWFPFLVAGALFSTRVAHVALVALLVRGSSAVRTSGPRAAPIAFLLGPLGDLAYCAGVWRGTIASRSLRPMIPVIRWRPGSGR
jgi:cellulose synthase/poly-beta-1,6-N-acetylglucosamine synthase-like glycosyltransferase